MTTPVLDVKGLQISVTGSDRKVLDGMSLQVHPGEVVAIVGESGSGKSTACLSLIGLLDRGLEVSAGDVRLDGERLVGLTARQWRRIRGTRLGIIFQDSLAALDPVRSIGFQMAEARRALGGGRREAEHWALDRLEALGFSDPAAVMKSFPHQLSGGMRQRVCAAIAFAGNPRVVLADEPTTALDVSLQGRMLRLLLDQTRESQSGLVLVSHDVSVVQAVADTVVVLYGGRVLESGPADVVLTRPRVPYTLALLESIPTLDPDTRGKPLATIPGDFRQHPGGCPFRDRCLHATGKCVETPEPCTDEDGRTFRCWNPMW